MFLTHVIVFVMRGIDNFISNKICIEVDVFVREYLGVCDGVTLND